MIINIAGMGAIICVIQIVVLMGIAMMLELFHDRRVANGTAVPKYAKDYEVENTPLAENKERETNQPASLKFRLSWDFTVIFHMLMIVILLATVAVCLPIGNSVYQSIRTRNFPTAEGIVLVPLSYDEPVAYQYRVNDRDYVGSGAYFGGGLSQNQSIEETYRKYPPETPVNVYYNPNDPTDSALERPDRKHWRDNFALGALLFAVAGVIFARRVWQSGKPSDS
jgi:hypothetical protein